MPETALEIRSGAELVRFQPNKIAIGGRIFVVLTGFENTNHKCWWCGEELKGKARKWCYGHMQQYFRYFKWSSARAWCIRRQKGICANCATPHELEVHHIVPLNGAKRYFSAYNLPWNLVGLCHSCHQEVHATMRPPKPLKRSRAINSWELARAAGQAIMPIC